MLIILAFYFVRYEKLYQSDYLTYFGERSLRVGGKIIEAFRVQKKYDVLLSGDSRGYFQLDPEEFKNKGLESFNIACESCELINFWKAYEALVLENRVRTYIISVSSFQINDYSKDYTDIENFSLMTMFERSYLLNTDYFSSSLLFYNNKILRKDFFPNANGHRIESKIRQARGYKEIPVYEGSFNENDYQCNPKLIYEHPWYEKYRNLKARKRVLSFIINEMKTKKSQFVLFNAPLNPGYRKCIVGTFVEKQEQEFEDFFRELTKGVTNIKFLDFFSRPELLTLKIDDFSDTHHMNARGAKKLSAYLADQI
ncbi:MAG: hypothetical protein M9962_05630 [Oligoflexia bacterium]|nr:hypothetical protein [Oligoflexia bacterium]